MDMTTNPATAAALATARNAELHPVEVAHDETLLELLAAAGTARAELERWNGYVLNAAATYRADHRGGATGPHPTIPSSSTTLAGGRDAIPAGALYYQAKTFTRGEEGYYVKGDGEGTRTRRASIDDALEVIDPEHRYLAARLEAEAALEAAVAAVVEHELGYTGWARFFLVVSSAGHVHSSMSCSTCNYRTAYAPVPAVSACSAAEAVELLGETLCSVCYPDAPVAGKPGKITAAAARKLVGA